MADTIFALSSAAGRAGVAVVRVSGPRAGEALKTLSAKALPKPRMAVTRQLSANGAPIDDALALWFQGPSSFTGEDVVEFHVHGGRAILAALFAALEGMGLRPAEAGEFTRRAVENGKFDLTRAEALADLIDAETEGQRRQALEQYEGRLAALYEDWSARLLKAVAWGEAAIDFADEEVPEDCGAEARAIAAGILKEIQAHLADHHRGELVREGLYLTVLGQPNAGKSSLVNALAKRDVAIVSEQAGTTRDVVEARLDLGGYPVTVADTAGLREAAEGIEAEGIRRALARAEAADLTLLVLDGAAAEPYAGLPEDLISGASLTVWNKADLAGHPKGLAISAKTGAGLPELLAELTALVRDRLQSATDAPPLLTRSRHRHALERAAEALTRAIAAPEAELMSEDLRLAQRELGRITGKVDIEDVLGVIFAEFCIGK
ncbi:MAG: tRNA uridine-5-carboxymethylaminomethyl(34) synthesis GTPase MnmE [Alphaproteobacteria bacterium]|nr:tRNA uridine-5-carboxymethylaminomethyl(34) synthesis GTPase MnmE [Alphaproteobacteria bacterium]